MPPKGTRAARRPPKKITKDSANAASSSSAVDNVEVTGAERVDDEEARRATANQILQSLPQHRGSSVAGGKVIANFQDNSKKAYSQEKFDLGLRHVLVEGYNLDVNKVKTDFIMRRDGKSPPTTGGEQVQIKDEDVQLIENAIECEKKVATDALKESKGDLSKAIDTLITTPPPILKVQ